MNISNGTFRGMELQILLQKAAVNSGMLILEWAPDKHYSKFIDMTVNYKGKVITVVANLRNITSAQLPNDPEMMRRQIESLDASCLPANTFDTVTLLIGVCLAEEKLVMGVWNPFDYGSHATNRSCYIRPEQLDDAANGQVAVMRYKTISPVYACDFEHFGELIERFMEDNSTR